MKFAFAFGLALAASAYAAPATTGMAVSKPETVPVAVAPVSGVAPVANVKVDTVPLMDTVKAVEPVPKPVAVTKPVKKTVVDVRSAGPAPIGNEPFVPFNDSVKKVDVVSEMKPMPAVKPAASVAAPVPVQGSMKPVAAKQTKPAMVFPAVPINTRPIGAQAVNSVPVPAAVEASIVEVLQKPVEAMKPVPATVAVVQDTKPVDNGQTMVVVEKVVAQPLPVVSAGGQVVTVVDARNVAPQKPVFVADMKPMVQVQAGIVQEPAKVIVPGQAPVVQGQAPVQTQFPAPVMEKAAVPAAQPVQQTQPIGAQVVDNIIVPVQVAKPLFARQDVNVPVGQSVPVAGLPQFVPIF